jgi:hypothetical protein
MGAIVDRLELTRDDVKTYLGLGDASKDAVIDLVLPVAKQLADDYCNNPFETTDEDTGETTDDFETPEIAATVKHGVIQLVVDLMIEQQARIRAALGGSSSSGQVIKEKEGDVEVTYAQTSGDVMSAGLGNTTLSKTVRSILDNYRLLPGC